MLFLVLFLGTEVNNAKCWFRIPYLGTIQPSEFMKVFLIIILAKLINDFNEKYISPTIMDEFKFLLNRSNLSFYMNKFGHTIIKFFNL